jgi:hypothetical protein
MADDRPFTRSLGWRVYLIGAIIVVLVVTVGGQWWVWRPKGSAEDFISLLSKGQMDQGNSMLRDPSSIQTDAIGNATIKARDGTTATLTQGELPLLAYGDRADRDSAPRTGIGDYLASRYRFQVATSGPALKGGQKKQAIVYCVAETDRIAIDTIKEFVSRWGVWCFLEADKVPGIDYGAVAYAFIGDEPAFIIWTDFRLTSPGDSNLGKSRGSVIGSFSLADGRRFDFKFEPRYAKAGTVTIGGREYKCADGRLFLIRDGREVMQLQRDLKELANIPEDESKGLADLARRDPEISSFYEAHTQKSATSKAP